MPTTSDLTESELESLQSAGMNLRSLVVGYRQLRSQLAERDGEIANLKQQIELSTEPCVINEARWLDERNAGATSLANTVLADNGAGSMSDGPCWELVKEWRRMKAELAQLKAGTRAGDWRPASDLPAIGNEIEYQCQGSSIVFNGIFDGVIKHMDGIVRWRYAVPDKSLVNIANAILDSFECLVVPLQEHVRRDMLDSLLRHLSGAVPATQAVPVASWEPCIEICNRIINEFSGINYMTVKYAIESIIDAIRKLPQPAPAVPVSSWEPAIKLCENAINESLAHGEFWAVNKFRAVLREIRALPLPAAPTQPPNRPGERRIPMWARVVDDAVIGVATTRPDPYQYGWLVGEFVGVLCEQEQLKFAKSDNGKPESELEPRVVAIQKDLRSKGMCGAVFNNRNGSEVICIQEPHDGLHE